MFSCISKHFAGNIIRLTICLQCYSLQCFDAVGWAAARKGIRPVKI